MNIPAWTRNEIIFDEILRLPVVDRIILLQQLQDLTTANDDAMVFDGLEALDKYSISKETSAGCSGKGGVQC